MPNLTLLSLFLVLGGLTACSDADPPNATRSAQYKIPNSEIRLTIEAKPVEPPATEFERFLYVGENQHIIYWTKLPTAAGTDSRTQLYKKQNHYILVDVNRDTFFISLDEKRVTKHLPEQADPSTMELIGQFALDDRKKWRFIPQSELAPASR